MGPVQSVENLTPMGVEISADPQARAGPEIEAPWLATIEPKVAEVRHSRKKSVTPMKSAPKTAKLEVAKSGADGWIIKRGRSGVFRVRNADTGFRVLVCFRDQNGARRERYCCYLSSQEWLAAKRGTLASFAGLVFSKVESRHASGDIDDARYQEIAPRLQALT